MKDNTLNKLFNKYFPNKNISKNHCIECSKDVTDGGFLLTTNNGLVYSCSDCIETILNKEKK